MKTFEERYTAWIDGALKGREAEEFEKELAAHPEEAGARTEMLALGDLLRRHSPPPQLANADFFNHQLMQKIESARRSAAPEAREKRLLFPIGRLAWLGALCVLLGLALFQVVVPKGPFHNEPENTYLAEILEATPGDSNISVTSVHAEKSGVTVLWLDGLEYLPASYALK